MSTVEAVRLGVLLATLGRIVTQVSKWAIVVQELYISHKMGKGLHKDFAMFYTFTSRTDAQLTLSLSLFKAVRKDSACSFTFICPS